MATISVIAAGGGDYTTIQAACDNASAGDDIEVYTGSYNENIDIDTNDGSSGNEITLKAAVGETPTITTSSGAQIFYLKGKDYWTFDFDNWVFSPTANMDFFKYTSPVGNINYGITVKNCVCSDSNIDDFFVIATNGVHVDDLTIQDCKITNFANRGVYLGSNGKFDGTLIERCWFGDFGNYGIVISTASNPDFVVTVRNCVFDQGAYAIYEANSTQNYTLNFYNNVVYSPSADGLYLASGSRSSTYNIKNNVIMDCGDYGVDDPNTSATYNIDYNCWYNNSSGDIRNESIGGNAQEGDPGFTNEAGDDFTLDGSGLADDNGVDLSGTGFSDDYAGTTRGAGGGADAWDIGAYDYVAAGGVTTRRYTLPTLGVG